MRRWVAVAILVGACAKKAGKDEPVQETKAPAVDAAPKVAGPDRWAASAVVGSGLNDFLITFDGPAATLEVNGAKLPLTNVTYTADRIAFTLDKPGGGSEVFELARQGDRADGTDTVMGTELVVRMSRLADGEAPRSAFLRPQTPRPPFPYASRDLDVTAPDGSTLAGTLTIPEGAGPFPAVILLSGSGQEDRDETIFGHKPFLLLADTLTRAGIATYRFDDRGTGKTTGAIGSLDTEIADAGAIIDALKQVAELDPTRLGLIGHSAAGIVAPAAAVAHPVAFIVLLAGCTRSGADYAAYQTAQTVIAAGGDEAAVATQRELQAKVTAAALQGEAEVRAVFTEMIAPMLEAQLGRTPTAEELEAAVAPQVAGVMDPWSLSYFRHDPRDAWKQLAIPALLLVGTKDTQVPAQMTIDALAEVVPADRLTAKPLDGLNHLFQRAGTGQVEEYVTIDETFDPGALAIVKDWILSHT